MQSETKINQRNKGVLPKDFTSELSVVTQDSVFNKVENTNQKETPIETENVIIGQPISKSTDYPHIRHPEAHRSSTFVVMGLAAVCGAVGGVVVAKDSNVASAIIEFTEKTFGEIFLMRFVFGAALLAVEFVLGFFALGDLLVWAVPLFAGLGLALRIAATKIWVLLPSSIVLLGVVAFGAAVSAGFSATLMSLARGGTIHLGSSPRRVFVLNFLGYLAATAACALYEGIILTVNR